MLPERAVVVAIVASLHAGGCKNTDAPDKPRGDPLSRFVALAEGATYQPILEGPPQSLGMESGRVVLEPGREGEKHSTKSYDELLVILQGAGELRITGEAPLTIWAPGAAYVPPDTEHAIANTEAEPLIYVYVAAPTTESR